MNLDYLTIVLTILLLSLVYYLFSKYIYIRYLKKRNKIGMDGREVATLLIREEELVVKLVQGNDKFDNYFDMSKRDLTLASGIINKASLTSLAIVSFEVSNVKMFSKSSVLWILKQIITIVITFFSIIGTLVTLLALIINNTDIYNIGISVFLLSVIFLILSFPFNIISAINSRNLLNKYSLVSEEEKLGVNLFTIFLSLASLNLLVSLIVITIAYILESLDIKFK